MDSIYLKLQKVRVAVNEKCTKKSGKNSYAGFEYFELKDFLPAANKEFLEQGLCPVFCIEKEFDVVDGHMVNVREVAANLTIYDSASDKTIVFKTPVADVVMGNKIPNPIQNLGAQHTYLKRYLYMNALELSENDIVDATAGNDKEEKKEVKTLATLDQVNMIMESYDNDNLQKIKEYYKVDNIEKLTVQQASQVLARKKKNNE